MAGMDGLNSFISNLWDMGIYGSTEAPKSLSFFYGALAHLAVGFTAIFIFSFYFKKNTTFWSLNNLKKNIVILSLASSILAFVGFNTIAMAVMLLNMLGSSINFKYPNTNPIGYVFVTMLLLILVMWYIDSRTSGTKSKNIFEIIRVSTLGLLILFLALSLINLIIILIYAISQSMISLSKLFLMVVTVLAIASILKFLFLPIKKTKK